MKLNLYALIALLTITLSCKETEVTPEVSIKMIAPAHVLKEGNEHAIDLVLRLNSVPHNTVVCYIDYGSSVGELGYAIFSKNSLNEESFFIDGSSISLNRVIFQSGEQEKVIKLICEDNDWFRGNEPIKMKVYTLAGQHFVLHDTTLIAFEENEPIPAIGFAGNFEEDTVRSYSSRSFRKADFKLTVFSEIPLQFKPKMYLSYDGNADLGNEYVVPTYVEPGFSINNRGDNPTIFTVTVEENYASERTIRVSIGSVSVGKVANGQRVRESFLLQTQQFIFSDKDISNQRLSKSQLPA